LSHPRDIQYVSQCSTAHEGAQTRRFVLGMHLQAISRSCNQQSSIAYEHLKAIFLRYDKYAQLAMNANSPLSTMSLKNIDTNTSKIIILNDKLIEHTCNIFRKKRSFMSRDDVIQNLRIGMMNAVRSYNTSSSFQFSTHAYWNMMQTHNRMCEKECSSIFGLSTEEYYKIFKMKYFIEEYFNSKGEYPSNEVVAKHLKCFPQRIADMANYPSRRVDASLYLADEKSNAEELLIEDETENAKNNGVRIKVEQLKQPMRSIIQRMFGMGKLEEKTMKAIAKDMGLSEAQVKNYKKKAFEILANTMKDDIQQ